MQYIQSSLMKSFSALVLFMMLGAVSFGQAATKAKAEVKDYPAHNPGWMTNLEKAYAESEATGKPILANFTGSDWCGWCVRLTKSVFSKEDFKAWAKDNVVLLELDFPKRKQLPSDLQQQNYKLAQAFQVRGYPTVWLFDLEKDENQKYLITKLGKTGYTKTSKEFIANMERMIANRK